MHWYLHLAVHYLDLFRHEVISTIAWEAVKTNIGATWPWQSIIVAIGAYFLIPRFRKWINDHFENLHKKLDKHHKETIDQKDQQHQELKQHITDTLERHHKSLKQHITDTLKEK